MTNKRTVNKSQKVRDYLAEHPDAGPTEVARALKQLKVPVALVSAIKGKSKAAESTAVARSGGAGNSH